MKNVFFFQEQLLHFGGLIEKILNMYPCWKQNKRIYASINFCRDSDSKFGARFLTGVAGEDEAALASFLKLTLELTPSQSDF